MEMQQTKLQKEIKTVKLGEYVISVKGKKPKRISTEKTKECPLPYVNIKVFEKGIIDEYTDGVGCALCEAGDFLMVWDGSRSGYVGKGIKGAIGSTLVKLDFPDIDNNYAYYFLQSKYVEINTRAKGVGIPHVDPNILWNYELLIPSKKTQAEIVSKIEELFSKLDKGIDNLKTAQQQLKIYRQAVLKWAFEGKLTNIKVAGLPEGWVSTKLGEVSKVSGGLTKNSKRKDFKLQLPFLRVGNVYLNYLDLSEMHTIGINESEIERVKLKKDDLLFVEGNGSLDQIGRAALWDGSIPNCVHQNHLIKARLLKQIIPKYALYFFCSKAGRDKIKEQANSTSGLHTLNLSKISKLELPLCSVAEQNNIIKEIESRLSIADKMEESINQSLQQAGVLRQSILKKAFEGKLVIEKNEEIFKPKNVYFYQMQVLGLIAKVSKKKEISHGEMTIAKYAYLVDKIYNVPTYYNFNRWHLGPYPKEMKTAIKNKQFFKIANYNIEVLNEGKLFKYENPFKEQLNNAVNDLSEIFLKYKGKDRSHKTELLATVCKVIEDIKSTELKPVRSSMKEWKINLKKSSFKNKAEKFSESETKKCLNFIVEKGWDKKLL